MTVPSHMGGAFYGDIEAWHVKRSKLLPCQACAVGGSEVPEQQNPQKMGSEWCRSWETVVTGEKVLGLNFTHTTFPPSPPPHPFSSPPPNCELNSGEMILAK